MTNPVTLPCDFTASDLCKHCGDTSSDLCNGFVVPSDSLSDQPERLPLFDASNPHEEFMNAIIKYGVVNACEWFGHEADSDFTWSTVEVLKERLSEAGKEIE